MRASEVGHALAKVLGIKVQDNDDVEQKEKILRGESIFSLQSADTFIEEEPRSLEWILDTLPDRRDAGNYLISLFPFLSWIGSYNVIWLVGDLIAGKRLLLCDSQRLIVSGITIGAVVVPQGMAYAVLANLPPQFGLYTSFMGVLIYWFFATSKDITIGVSDLSS